MNFAIYFNGDSKYIRVIFIRNGQDRPLPFVFFFSHRINNIIPSVLRTVGGRRRTVQNFPSCNKHDFIL